MNEDKIEKTEVDLLSAAISRIICNRCYYMNAPCSWQPVTGEGHLIAQVV